MSLRHPWSVSALDDRAVEPVADDSGGCHIIEVPGIWGRQRRSEAQGRANHQDADGGPSEWGEKTRVRNVDAGSEKCVGRRVGVVLMFVWTGGVEDLLAGGVVRGESTGGVEDLLAPGGVVRGESTGGGSRGVGVCVGAWCS